MVTNIVVALVSAVVGFIAGIFVYRNNKKTIGKIADGIDDIADGGK